VGQVTLALVLLVTCGLFVRSVQRGLTVDTGMDDGHLLVFTLDLGVLDYPPAEGRAFYRRLEERAGRMAGVASAALAGRPPLAGLGSVQVTASNGKAGHGLSTSVAYVGRTWFETTGIPLLAGTSFPSGLREDAPGRRVAVVSRTLADRLWPGQSPLGRVLAAGRGEGRKSFEVVGVARDVRTRLEQPPTPVLFLPLSSAYSPSASLLIRTDGPAGPLVPEVRKVVEALDARLPVQSVETVEQARRKALAPWRLVASGMGFLGALALLLAAAGLYGVVAFAVTQRTREIGVRMALGADRTRVLGMVFRWTLVLLGTGAALGMLLAALVASLIRKALFGVSPLDPLTYLGVGAVLVLVGVAAALRPALRAASVQPSRTLAA
jgi:putative ABC transport system permease protein